MTVLVFVESPDDELSQQALTFARGLGDEVHAVLMGPAPAPPDGLGAYGVSVAHVAAGFAAYAPAAWAQAIVELVERTSPAAVVGPGTDRGNEVLAHLAAKTDQPMAANCVSLAEGDPPTVTRVRWGGSLLEEARLHGSPMLLTVAPHAVAAKAVAPQAAAGTVGAPATVSVEEFIPTVADADLLARVSERAGAVASGVSLTDADVVVSGGRGVGSAEGFAVIEELAELLGGAVGCSRAVTSAGWRPHTDQVGQTGTKISPEIYIACGISGATQHMAGCKGAKKLLAINPDGEASIFASADYAVIGDLHDIVPAISAEIRKARSA
ncbi:MAG TPA: electron transfer flavoprotein subunit alpha/FixB family protein [Solirubrobacteraceae bacterium]|jgi:electron transfer flavoprotein alpha subunit|nr:electron transfer flavoprotein subunit alpha/FixB family protein [Solirubrobacteraceae bacterium]